MIEKFEDNIWIIKNKCTKIKQILGLISIVCVLIAIVYSVCWMLLKTDDLYFNAIVVYFAPFTALFNSDVTSVDAYSHTSFCMLIVSTIFFILSAAVNDVKKQLIKSEIRKNELLSENCKKQAQKVKEFEYKNSLAKNYSICVSIDYNDDSISQETKTKLNKTIYFNFEKNVKKINKYSNMYYDNALIILSKDFYAYDYIYGFLLKYLAVTKKAVFKKYGLTMIPSITTDAYNGYVGTNQITKNHFEMKGCNFKNRAIATNNFCKKYKDIKKSKYIGIPIGEYTTFNNSNIFELNIIYKNLNNTLNEISC